MESQAKAKKSLKRNKKGEEKVEVEEPREEKVIPTPIPESEPEAPLQWILPGEMRVDLTENVNQLNQALAQAGDFTHKIIGLKKQRETIDETIEKLEKDIRVFSEQIGRLYVIRNQMIDKACYKQNVLASMYDFNLQQGVAIKKQEFR